MFAGSDQMALEFMSAMRDRGRSARGGFSIIGIDGMPNARCVGPPLSSVCLDVVASGEAGVSTVRQRIETGERPEQRIVDPFLVARASTAPCGGATA